ncbi:MAG: flagellar hook-length control protein FliK [Lachnospiraceae bacterium]|nr:flagellar hook-length control protein FliK [Lachnospiraceae bacterium]
MQIGNRVIQSYDANIQDRSKLDNAKAAEQTKQTQSSSAVAALKEGAVFKGEVLNIVDDKITISLEDKAQLMARLQQGVELGVGDRLLFAVKENNASQILIKPLFDSLHSAQTQVLERALDAAGLSPTEKNFSAAKELMEAGMPVDKGNIVKLLSQSMKFEGTSMQTLVGLNKMNIPVNEANIAQYERYQGMQHQLSGDIGTAAEGMASFTHAFPEGTSGQTLVSVANQILDMFMPEQMPKDAVATNELPQEATQNGQVVNQNGQSIAEGTMLTGEQGLPVPKQGSLEGQEALLKAQTNVNSEHSVVANDAKDKLTTESLAQQGTEQVSEEHSQSEQGSVKNTVSLTQIAEHTGLNKEAVTNLSNLMSKAGVSGEQLQTMFQNANSPEELMKNMLQTLTTSGANEHAIRQVLDSREFKDMLTDVIKKNWALNPKDMKDPKEIDELYERVVKESKSFENLIANNGGEPKQFEQSFQNMRQNMQFMEQLNNQMIYAQMPLKLSNQNANSELYVYADKRKLAQKKDGISVMLHLDMDNLGQTDVHVTLTGSNVNARFYLNDQESVDIVADNINQLAKQLADRGFSLTNEVIKRQPQESINKVVDEVIDENAERSIKRYTFDART